MNKSIAFSNSQAERAVLLVGNFLSAGASTRGVCEEVGPRLTAKGWTVLTTSAKQHRLPRLVDMVSTAWRKRHMYSVAQVDVYSGPAFAWAEAVCGTLGLAGKPYVLALRGGNLPGFAQRSPNRVRRLLHAATAVTTPSHYLLDRMRPYREDMALLPNAIEIGAYPFKLRARAQPRLVWVRGFHRIYNPELAAEVMALLVREFPGAHLTMVGPDKGDGSLEATQRLAAKLGIRGKVTFPGGVPKAEVPNWISRGDVFINTTSVDNTPVSVLEAMACGLCIVSTDVGGLPYLLESGQDALLVPPDDPQAMASAVRRLLTDHYLAARLSYNAHKKATQFDWSMILPYWEALLTAVADNDGGVRSQAGARW